MLNAGIMLGPYEILAQVGAGGMGEVYKARDTRLDRIVAIKVLPSHLAGRAELRERFDREARAIANLQHPHICVLYDIGEQDGTAYLVMEFLEGETLAQRLLPSRDREGAVARPLPLDQTLQYAIEISDALDKAHRKGFTHRDIKPANIMLTKAGSQTISKILDFGLAKLKQQATRPVALAPDDPTPPVAPPKPESPTLEGTILGTVQYMAPEQVEGKVDDIDGRTDIFSFGATVYEMLTGKKAFEGKTAASVMAKILEVDPPPISSLQPLTPPVLDRVVKKCLAKDPDARWQSAGDLHDELQWIAEGGSQAGLPAPVVAHRKHREKFAWAATVILLVVSATALSLFLSRDTGSPAQLVQFSVDAPATLTFDFNAQVINISPDGRMLAVNTVDSFGQTHIWVRPLDSQSGRLLPGTASRNQPFWSSDSSHVAFYAEGKLRKIAVSGGLPQVIADAPGGGNGASGSWNQDGTVLFVPTTPGVIHRVSANSGPATPVTVFDDSRNEIGHSWPHFLPDGRHFLYLARSSSPENNAIFVGSLDSNQRTFLVSANSNPAYVQPGFLLFNREGTLLAQPFDAESLELTGEPFPIADHVQFNAANGRTAFSASLNGVLAYRTGAGSQIRQLTWFDRTGMNLGPVGEPSEFNAIALSPDERRIAGQRIDPAVGAADIWLLELSRGFFTRLTSTRFRDQQPIWSPDGGQVVFSSDPKGEFHLYVKNLNSGAEEPLLESEGRKYAEEWSRDGQSIIYRSVLGGKADFWLLPLSGERQPKLLLESPFPKGAPRVSPNGRWLAYTSQESGEFEVYVQPLQREGEKLRISSNGGGQPRWREDGTELFYLAFDGMIMAVPLQDGATLEPGVPKSLFQTRISTVSPDVSQYAVTRDGQRFLVNSPTEEHVSAPITVVLNWTAALNK